MLSDAHCHPFDLSKFDDRSEASRQGLMVMCAASSWSLDEFSFLERRSIDAEGKTGPPMTLCFGVHPQLPAIEGPDITFSSLATLDALVADHRVDAIGEVGFDLYDDRMRATEKLQDELFLHQLECALSFDLPIVLHLRKAMHKVFACTRQLSRLPSVIFHSYSGTLREAESLLNRGVNAFFSFGTSIALNHKRAMEVCALLPPDRLLVETDAPYQPLRGHEYSSWVDLPEILTVLAKLRSLAGSECSDAESMEDTIYRNFIRAYRL